jgi:hypothetical protein
MAGEHGEGGLGADSVTRPPALEINPLWRAADSITTDRLRRAERGVILCGALIECVKVKIQREGAQASREGSDWRGRVYDEAGPGQVVEAIMADEVQEPEASVSPLKPEEFGEEVHIAGLYIGLAKSRKALAEGDPVDYAHLLEFGLMQLLDEGLGGEDSVIERERDLSLPDGLEDHYVKMLTEAAIRDIAERIVSADGFDVYYPGDDGCPGAWRGFAVIPWETLYDALGSNTVKGEYDYLLGQARTQVKGAPDSTQDAGPSPRYDEGF